MTAPQSPGPASGAAAPPPGLPAGFPMRMGEFIALLAVIMSLPAFATDLMLPALPDIGRGLGVAQDNDRQLIIPVMFFGMAVAQVFYGPVLDAFGRKMGLYIGLAIFLAGTLLCVMAPNFNVMLAGRLLQGIGAAGPQVMTSAVARDLFVGRAMARVMSMVMMIFILVPVFAPLLGKGLLSFAPWPITFWTLAVHALVIMVWAGLRLPETLPPDKHRPFSARAAWDGLKQVIAHPVSFGYTMASGVVFGALVAYLSASEQILAELYGLGPDFVYAFGAGALAIGFSSFVNSRLVMRYGMRTLSRAALAAFCVLALCGLFWAGMTQGKPPFEGFMLVLCLTFFCCGLLFGNMRALAMEPMGHIAGMAAAATGSLSSLVSAPVGGLIARAYDGSVRPFFAGFLVMGLVSFGFRIYAERGRARLGAGSGGSRP